MATVSMLIVGGVFLGSCEFEEEEAMVKSKQIETKLG